MEGGRETKAAVLFPNEGRKIVRARGEDRPGLDFFLALPRLPDPGEEERGILRGEDARAWIDLDVSEPKSLLDLLHPFPAKEMSRGE